MSQDEFDVKAREHFPPEAWSASDLQHILIFVDACAREARAKAFEEAAKEAEMPRLMLLTREQIEGGILSDDHLIIKARAQMRKEIAAAIRARANPPAPCGACDGTETTDDVTRCGACAPYSPEAP